MRRVLPLALALLAFAALAVLWIVTDRRAPQRIYDGYSTASTADHGLSLLSGVLAKQRKVEMLTRPIGRVSLERDAVVFRVVAEVPRRFDPESLSEKEVGPPRPEYRPLLNDPEEGFVRNGGRMIIAAAAGTLNTSKVHEKIAKKVFPIWPAVGEVELDDTSEGFATLGPRMHTLFAAGSLAIIARERIGSGELFLISTPEIFRNDGLARGNRLLLLTALAGNGRPVYFDEVAHGIVSGDGSLALLKEWNLGPFLILLALLAVLIFWREGRRVGPPVDDYRETRSDSVDLVRSLGALYHEVTTDAEAIALYHDALTRTVASQTGLRGDALRKRVDDLTGGLAPPPKDAKMPAAIFRRDLNTINEAFLGVKTHANHRRHLP